MLINTFKKNIKSILIILGGLPMLCCVLVAFQSYTPPNALLETNYRLPKPQIKTKVHKKFQLKSNEASLQFHTKTTYNIHGEVIEFAEFTEGKKGRPALKELKIIKYNVQGLYIGTMVYDKNNALIWDEETDYNDTEQITKITQTNYGENPSSTYTLITYDDYGNIALSQTFNHHDHQISESKRSYSSSGELLSALDWVYVYKNMKPVKKILSIDNQYNLAGQITQSTRLAQEGKERKKDIKLFKNSAVIDWTTYKNGRLVSHFKHKTPDTTRSPYPEYELPPPIPEQRVILEYDDSKRDPLENIPHKTLKSVALKTNKQGLPTKRITKEHNQITEVVYYYYNEKNQLESEKIHDKISRETKEIQYEYDQFNNPLKKTFLKNEVIVQLHSFDYEYYRQY